MNDLTTKEMEELKEYMKDEYLYQTAINELFELDGKHSITFFRRTLLTFCRTYNETHNQGEQ